MEEFRIGNKLFYAAGDLILQSAPCTLFNKKIASDFGLPDLAAAVDRLVVRLGAASDAFEKRQQEFEAEFRKRLDDYAAEASRRAAADAAEFEKRRGEYAAHFEKRLSDYEQSFETRQKEYVEFFKRELEALERRAKAADEARVETEARLARIAAALRG